MDNVTEKYADIQRAFLLGAVDDIEVGVVLSGDDRVINKANEEEQLG